MSENVGGGRGRVGDGDGGKRLYQSELNFVDCLHPNS